MRTDDQEKDVWVSRKLQEYRYMCPQFIDPNGSYAKQDMPCVSLLHGHQYSLTSCAATMNESVKFSLFFYF